jgi:SAM-dependent methyltransferase
MPRTPKLPTEPPTVDRVRGGTSSNPTPAAVAAGEASPPSARELSWCRACQAPSNGADGCLRCGQIQPVRDGILEAIGELAGRNRIVAAFYDGPGWRRFRKWERLFLAIQGGARRARMEILRHLLTLNRPTARVLEVGIGDGENLPLLPASWTIYGADISRVQLESCQQRHPEVRGRLAWAEAEALPFPDGTFDACYSIGGFTYFSDHTAAWRELNRVTRSGGWVVVADERPGLHRAGIGHLIGLPALDRIWLGRLGLDPEFIDMVLRHDFVISSWCGEVWPRPEVRSIWHGLGYCLVHRVAGAEFVGLRNASRGDLP